ncbi:hypothetical protein P4K96_29045 [Bacillus cereus]|uniref:hypothetical protein n=1 Tax=Paenibacillus melissococcoides TaxID=2912268 RepID=UPI002DC182D5|nr:hypothetical protein [Bacillus cereus]
MKIDYCEMTKEEIHRELDSFMKRVEVLFDLIKEVRENRSADSLERLKTEFLSIKTEIKEHYKVLSSSKTKRNEIVNSYYWPAIQDIYVHISSLGTNHISFRSLEKVGSAAYDIRSYARYYQPKEYKE